MAGAETDLLRAVRALDVRVQVLVLEGDHELVVGPHGQRERRRRAGVFLLFLEQRDDRHLAPREALAHLLQRPVGNSEYESHTRTTKV